MFLHIPQLLDPAALQSIWNILDNAAPQDAWMDGRVTSGPQSAEVKNNQQMPELGQATQQARALVMQALERSPHFLAGTLPQRVYPPGFNRYSGQTNAFGTHIDNAMRRMPGTAQYLRTDISCTVFLSHPQAYEGGELVIAQTSGQHHVKLPAGDAYLYPATTLHHVNPVTQGARVACFFWVQSMVPRADQRQLLYDLDIAIVRLRQLHGETPEAIALTGTYHNLLRMWAQV
jgi:PKHD-type hydroxylase